MAPQKRKREPSGDAAEPSGDGSRGERGGRRVDAAGGASTAAEGEAPVAALRFASESWTGLKPTNEDRTALGEPSGALGPAFAVFDGHGGTFSADFLVRNLLKGAAASVRQAVGERALGELEASRERSRGEAARREEVLRQLAFVGEQLAQAEQLAEAQETADEGQEDARALQVQLEAVRLELESEARLIEDEEAERRERRSRWYEDADDGIQRGIVDAFRRADEQILRKNTSRDGSTALVAWFIGEGLGQRADQQDVLEFDPSVLYVANLGDCRAILGRRGGAVVRLSSDHKPDRPDERMRIERAGGCVGVFSGTPRVFSAAAAGLALQGELSTFLAVSRAFGDRSLKIPTALVSCEPEIRRYRIKPEDSFVLLACDGIWDVLSDEEAAAIVRERLSEPKAAADAVVKAAYIKGSADNLTATVIKICDLNQGSLEASSPDAGDGLSEDHENGEGTSNTAIENQGNTADAVAADRGDEIDMFNL